MWPEIIVLCGDVRVSERYISFLLQLLDLCFLDIGCLQFTYSVLATSALYHLSSEEMALSVSGWFLLLVFVLFYDCTSALRG